MKFYGPFTNSMYQAILNTANPDSFYMLSLKDDAFVTVSKATFSDYSTVSFDYHLAIVDTYDFGDTPGGKVDVFYEDDPAETESWFVCTS